MADDYTAGVICIELLPGCAWRKTGPEEFPEACLLAPRTCVKIGDHAVDVHVEAIAVVMQDVDPVDETLEHSGEIQIAAHDDYQGELDNMGDCFFQTIRIWDHDYVLRIQPHSV